MSDDLGTRKTAGEMESSALLPTLHGARPKLSLGYPAHGQNSARATGS
jgi:hypothetical protein